jgi:hypothetical protein
MTKLYKLYRCEILCPYFTNNGGQAKVCSATRSVIIPTAKLYFILTCPLKIFEETIKEKLIKIYTKIKMNDYICIPIIVFCIVLLIIVTSTTVAILSHILWINYWL